MTGENFSHINQALRRDVNRLWDDCFGDLALPTQRLLKVYGMRSNKEAYQHRARELMLDMKMWRNLQYNVDNEHFAPDSPQVKAAEEAVTELIGQFKKGKSRAARYLRYFLKDKKIKISVCKSLDFDASMDGYNPATKEIYIDLNAGIFTSAHHGKAVNKDLFAVTLGHELGHAVERLNRGLECDAKRFSSNSWEIESFCDAFGSRLATDAGYSLQPCIEVYEENAVKGREPEQPNVHPPLKQRIEWLTMAENAFQSSGRPVTPFDEKVTTVEWSAQKIEEQLWANLKRFADKGKAKRS